MRNCFYGGFISGMQDVVAGVVRERLPDVTVKKLLDGAIIFETETSYDRLNFFCFNNIFAVIDILEFDGGERSRQHCIRPMEYHMRRICGGENVRGAAGGLPERSLAVISRNNRKIRTFRLVCSFENQPASVDEKIKLNMESYIRRNSSLKADRAKPDTEFWFLYRREGFSLFMKRLTRSAERSLHPGELPSRLAWLLCRLGNPGPGETIIDPFCGYGAIPEAALKHFPVKKVYALDIDPLCIKIAGQKSSLKNERCEIRRADLFSPSGFLPPGGVDLIISDPPWGMYRETGIPIDEFYEKMLVQFSKLLKRGGRAVLLSGAVQEFESAVERSRLFRISGTIPILVSGKKASVYTLVADSS